MNPLRKIILDEAESWIGTPYEHLQRCKGAGVDCGQLLLGVFENVGLIPHVDTEYYPRDFHLHRDREWYAELVLRFARPLAAGEEPTPGDLVLYRVGRVYSHGAIVARAGWPQIIHSYVTRGVMQVDGTQGHLMKRPHAFYRPLAFGE